MTKLALWEPPYILEGTRKRPPADTASIYRAFVAEGRRDKAAEYFMAEVVGLPADFVAMAKESPWWPAQEAIAHTLAYDATVMGDYSIPAAAATVAVPTRVFTGGASEEWMKLGNQAVQDVIPGATGRVVPDQQHNVDPAALAPFLTEFFA